MRRPLETCVLAAIAALAGCDAQATGPGMIRPPEPVARVDRVDLRVFPTPINWDEDPGLDGVQASVFFYQVTSERVRAVTVKGTLEFLLFEGRTHQEELSAAQPFITWSYPSEEMPLHLFRTLGIWCYRMQLGWGTKVPKSSTITLVARYRPPGGEWIYSTPMLIAMEAK